jgi:hypothetical protein
MPLTPNRPDGEIEMHPSAETNKYVGMLFMKMSPEYFALGREGIKDITLRHVKDLSKYSPQLSHVLCTGMCERYDQITIMEADTLEEIYDAAMDFRMGAKAGYIDIVQMVVGIKAPPRSRATRSKVSEDGQPFTPVPQGAG